MPATSAASNYNIKPIVMGGWLIASMLVRRLVVFFVVRSILLISNCGRVRTRLDRKLFIDQITVLL